MADAIEGKENVQVEEMTDQNGDPLDSAKLLSGTKRRAEDGPENESPSPQDGDESHDEILDGDVGRLIAKDKSSPSQREGGAENADSEDNILSKQVNDQEEGSADDQKVDGERKIQASAEDSCEKKDTMEDDVGVIEETNASKIDIHRPVKRARSAYFIFMDDKRAEVQKQHLGEGVATVARALGLIWSGMTEEEKLPYQQKAASEREQVAAATEAWKAAGGGCTNVEHNAASKPDGSLIFPVARIRKICKLDPDVRGLSKEALLLITKAVELAAVKLGLECVKTAQIQNRRKLLPDDVAQVCSAREQFLFLRDDIQDLHRQQQNEAAANKPATNKQSKTKDNTAAAKNSKPMTDYFKAA